MGRGSHVALVTLANIIKDTTGFGIGFNLNDVILTTQVHLECIAVGSPGTFALKVGVSQRKKKVDYDKAKRAAVFSVIFNGVPGGSNGCYPQDPLLNEDAFEKNFAYFQDFFDTGKFVQFVSLSNEEYIESIKMKKGYKLRMDVVIRYDNLKEKLKRDGMLSGLDSYF